MPLAPEDPVGDAAEEAREAAEAAVARARMARLTVLRRPIRVGLVGCSATKRPGVHKARDLYLGNFFRRALPIALATCDETWILSARHRLVSLDQELADYNEQLPTRQSDRGYWCHGVLTALHNAYEDLPLHLVFFAGAPYVEGITGFDPRTERSANINWATFRRHPWTYETPLRGLDRPERFAWFEAHATGASPQENLAVAPCPSNTRKAS